jgi:type II secretory pathway pseudopilin PulG
MCLLQLETVPTQARRAFTLVEATVALAIASVAIVALVTGFVFALHSSEASGYSLAANQMALQGYERTRAATWDAMSLTNVDELVASNFPPYAELLDAAVPGTNKVYGTNYTTITTVSTNPLLKVVQVDCVYSLHGSGRLITNSIVSCRATETGQQNFQPSAPPAVSALPPAGGTSSLTNSRVGASNAVNDPGGVVVINPPPANNNNGKVKKPKKPKG